MIKLIKRLFKKETQRITLDTGVEIEIINGVVNVLN